MKIRRYGLAVMGFVLLLFWSGGCGQLDGQGTDGTEYTGSVIQVEKFNCTACMLTVGTPILATMDVTFANKGVYEDSEVLSDVLLEYYVVEYYSSDAGSVPLSPMKFFGISLPVPAGATSNELKGFPLVNIDTQNEFLSKGGDPYLYPVYQAVVTFYGHNEFGYPVSVELNIGVIFGP